MTVRMVGEKLAREAGRRSASVEVDERKLAGAGAAAAIQAVREQAASMSDVLVQRHGGMCEAMYTSCRDQAPVEYVRGSLLLSTDGLPQWNPSTVHTRYVVQ